MKDLCDRIPLKLLNHHGQTQSCVLESLWTSESLALIDKDMRSIDSEFPKKKYIYTSWDMSQK